MSGQSTERWLRAGIAAARAGEHTRARDLLTRVVQEDEANLSAWLWLCCMVEDVREQRYCAEKVRGLLLGPDYRAAAGSMTAQPAHNRVRPLGAGPAIGWPV